MSADARTAISTWRLPASPAGTGGAGRAGVGRDGSFATYLARYRVGGLSPAVADSRPAGLGGPDDLSPAGSHGSTAAILPAKTAPSAAAGGAPAEVGRSGVIPSSPASPGSTPTGAPIPGTKPMALADFPRPAGDNGRCMHWVPITHTSDDVVDRYVAEAEKMGIKWMVFLNEGTKIGDNDYLVKRLVEKGIMPIMRIYTPNGQPIQGDVQALVRHYRQLGVSYFQLYNEPNLNVENPDGVPNVDRYVDDWIRAARDVVAAGGLPGFGSLSPGGNFDDVEFFRRSLDAIKARGEAAILDRAWISLHNYTLNHPLNYTKDSNAYLKFRWYDAIVREKLGRSLPIIGTEGGTFVGSHEDTTLPPVSQQMQIDMVLGAYDYVRRRQDPYYFAYTYWLIANEAGGGHDKGFSRHALFRPDGVSPLVDALRRTATATATATAR